MEASNTDCWSASTPYTGEFSVQDDAPWIVGQSLFCTGSLLDLVAQVLLRTNLVFSCLLCRPNFLCIACVLFHPVR